MLGTIVNSAAVILGSVLGLFIKGAERFEKPIINALALGVIFMAAAGVINGLVLENTNSLLYFLSLVIGTIIGELLDIDGKFNKLGDALGNRFSSGGNFSKGFVTASLIYCVGAMSIIGAFEDSLTGNHSVLFAKSVLDGTTSVILSSVYGIGVLFSGFTVLIYQGMFVLLAKFISPFISEVSLNGLSTVGNVLIAAIGFDMLGVAKVKYANMLPAMFIPLFVYLPIVQRTISMIFGVFSL